MEVKRRGNLHFSDSVTGTSDPIICATFSAIKVREPIVELLAISFSLYAAKEIDEQQEQEYNSRRHPSSKSFKADLFSSSSCHATEHFFSVMLLITTRIFHDFIEFAAWTIPYRLRQGFNRIDTADSTLFSPSPARLLVSLVVQGATVRRFPEGYEAGVLLVLAFRERVQVKS
jgi:hypothetical protein